MIETPYVDLSSITEPALLIDSGVTFENPTAFWISIREKTKNEGQPSEDSNIKSSNPFERDVIDNWKDANTDEWEVTGFDQQFQQTEISISFKLLDFLEQSLHIKLDRVADCGAGIGRVTDHLLSKRFNTVDLYERSEKLLQFAQQTFQGNPRIGDFINTDLKEVDFKHKYDVIWVQMVSGYFDDEELVDFYVKCRDALTPNGVVVFKDFISPGYSLQISYRLAEVFRSRAYNKLIFNEAGFEVVYTSDLDPADIDSYVHLVAMVLKPKAIADSQVSSEIHQKINE
jgi:protein N-terminal methyltransferase